MTDEFPITSTPANMPAEIAKGIVAVMGKIGKLSRDGTNRSSNASYKYASVDAFFEMLAPIMSEAGIFTMVIPIKSDLVERKGSYDKIVTWLDAAYDVFLVHESGAIFGPHREGVMVVFSGPQSYAAARSFIEKYYLRSLFKIATGEPDADADSHASIDMTRDAPAPAAKIDNQASSSMDDRIAAKKRTKAAIEYVAKAKIMFSSISNPDDLRRWWSDNVGIRKSLMDSSDPLYIELREAYLAHAHSISGVVSLQPVEVEPEMSNQAVTNDYDEIPF